VFVAAGRGLAAAHRAGLVHRDFKPDNVLIARDGRVLVTDFGLVSGAGSADDEDGAIDDTPRPGGLLGEAVTRDGTILGTPGYIPPEQQAGRPVDARADQYAFGRSLAVALAPPRRVPPWLRGVLGRAQSPDPAARFASMDELLARLTRGPVVTWR